MVSFDSRDPGTSSDEWLRDPRWAALPALDLAGVRQLLVLAAHPDDETLGAGGSIALARALGIPVTVVVVTGEASRRGEARSATAELGVSDLRFLGFTDGRVREDRDSIARSLDPLATELDGALLLAPWRGDGHRDHRVLGEIATGLSHERGMTLWSYPLWMWHWATPGHAEIPWSEFAVAPLGDSARLAKAAALGHYVSQTSGPVPMLHSRFLEHFARPFEVFAVDESGVGRGRVELSRRRSP